MLPGVQDVPLMVVALTEIAPAEFASVAPSVFTAPRLEVVAAGRSDETIVWQDQPVLVAYQRTLPAELHEGSATADGLAVEPDTFARTVIAAVVARSPTANCATVNAPPAVVRLRT